jgi:UDP-glucose 4-epimerase
MSVWKTTNPYWKTKFLIEQILEDLSKFSWFNVINLRYFNPIWAHFSWFLWETSVWKPNNLMPFIMKVAKWELEEIKVFWDDYDTPDWTWVRDYIDVVDLVEWHLKAYENILKWFNVYNLWMGKWISVLEVIKKTEDIIWRKIKFKIEGRRNWDLANVYCNAWKSEKELCWKAKINLEESIRNSWKFYNK